MDLHEFKEKNLIELAAQYLIGLVTTQERLWTETITDGPGTEIDVRQGGQLSSY